MHQISPAEVLEDIELRVLLWRTVWAMPENLRKIITHLYVCDKPLKEVANLLGTSEKGINVLHFLAIADLKERVKTWHLR